MDSIKKRKWFNASILLMMILAVFALLSVGFLANKTIAEDNGPSESTRKFFGERGGGPGRFEPDECKREQESRQEGDESKYRQEGEQLSAEIRQKEEALRNATSDEERSRLQTELEALKQRASEMQSRSGDQGQEQNRQEGPSAECKAAIVKMGKEKMATFAATITNNILPKLAKVDEIITKVEAKIPELKNIGVSAETIAKLETNIAAIKSNAEIMKSFMNNMVQTLNEFLSLADTDTEAAFAKMQNMHKSGKGDSAATAADALVSAFTELEKIIEELKQQGGSDGNQ